jgi:hypothetical protein
MLDRAIDAGSMPATPEARPSRVTSMSAATVGWIGDREESLGGRSMRPNTSTTAPHRSNLAPLARSLRAHATPSPSLREARLKLERAPACTGPQASRPVSGSDGTRTRDFRRDKARPLLDATRLGLTYPPHSTSFDDTSQQSVGPLAPRSHAVAGLCSAEQKVPGNEQILSIERTGIEPVTSGLQTHLDTRRHPTPTDQTSMVEPNSCLSSDRTRHRSTGLCSHRARTAGA